MVKIKSEKMAVEELVAPAILIFLHYKALFSQGFFYSWKNVIHFDPLFEKVFEKYFFWSTFAPPLIKHVQLFSKYFVLFRQLTY